MEWILLSVLQCSEKNNKGEDTGPDLLQKPLVLPPCMDPRGLLGTSEGPSTSLGQTYLGSTPRSCGLSTEVKRLMCGDWEGMWIFSTLFFGSLAIGRRWFSGRGWKTTRCAWNWSPLWMILFYPSTVGSIQALRSISESTQQGGELVCFPMVLSPLTGEPYSRKPFRKMIEALSL